MSELRNELFPINHKETIFENTCVTKPNKNEMSSDKPFSLISRIKSFGHALAGWQTLIISEPNAIIHVFAAVVTIVLGFVFHISNAEWLAVILSIVLVLSAELFNTAIEVMCDFVEPNRHPKIKKIKDLSAGAVLIIALGALTVGLIIFIPKIF